MLAKEERKAWNEAFWAGFKMQMRASMSVTGRCINWTNYPTQVKNTYLRMICEGKKVAICYCCWVWRIMSSPNGFDGY